MGEWQDVGNFAAYLFFAGISMLAVVSLARDLIGPRP